MTVQLICEGACNPLRAMGSPMEFVDLDAVVAAEMGRYKRGLSDETLKTLRSLVHTPHEPAPHMSFARYAYKCTICGAMRQWG